MPILTPRRFFRTLLLATVPGVAIAASAPAADPDAPAVNFLKHFTAPGLTQDDDSLVLEPGAAWYPDSEAATGAQGMAIVVMDLAPDGRVAKTTLAASTHVPALDAQALRLASQLHWMGARKPPPQASVRVRFVRDTIDSVRQKTCAELNADVAWLKAHDPAQPPENVGALQVIRGILELTSKWLPGRPVDQQGRAAMDVASRRTVEECAAHPDQRLRDTFPRLLNAAAQAHENEPARPAPVETASALPRTILHMQRDDPESAGVFTVLARDPDYPADALAAGQQGDVQVQADLDDHGAIEQVHVVWDYTRSPLLTAAAPEIFRRHQLAEAHLDTRDPATLHAALLGTVKFERDDSTSITSLDCATYHQDAMAWRGDTLSLPDYQALLTVLRARAVDVEHTPGRRPRREQWLHDKNSLRKDQLKATDADCAATPAKPAIDAFIDAIDDLKPREDSKR